VTDGTRKFLSEKISNLRLNVSSKFNTIRKQVISNINNEANKTKTSDGVSGQLSLSLCCYVNSGAFHIWIGEIKFCLIINVCLFQLQFRSFSWDYLVIIRTYGNLTKVWQSYRMTIVVQLTTMKFKRSVLVLIRYYINEILEKLWRQMAMAATMRKISAIKYKSCFFILLQYNVSLKHASYSPIKKTVITHYKY
jgi:hypothetical protein